MLARLRENGPVVLVPGAWAVVVGAHTGAVTQRTFLIAHTVMALLLGAFTVLSWSEMTDGVLRVWKAVLVTGFFFTVAGIVGLVGFAESLLLGVSLYGWILAPTAGLGYTAREGEAPYAYAFGVSLSLIGAVLYTASILTDPSIPVSVVAIAVVGAGQTVGIADAVYRY